MELFAEVKGASGQEARQWVAQLVVSLCNIIKPSELNSCLTHLLKEARTSDASK
jgi:hypothetical protein